MRTVYILALSNVHGNIDNLSAIAVSLSQEALVKWEQEQRAPAPYRAEEHPDSWGRTHAYQLVYKDGPLKWFNPGSDPARSFGGILAVESEQTDDQLEEVSVRNGLLWVTMEPIARM